MNRKGFTLLELLMVVIIVGVLAAIGIPQYAASLEKAKGADAKESLAHIYREEELYYGSNREGGFTDSIDALGNDVALNTKCWNFSIDTPTSASFVATATRISGSHSGQTITLDDSGTFSGDWEYIK